jgi:hypothetical protein
MTVKPPPPPPLPDELDRPTLAPPQTPIRPQGRA